MDINLILNAIKRIETDLAIIKDQLNETIPAIKTKKLTKKQLLYQEALRTLEERKQQDKIKAKKKFKKELEELEEKRKVLASLENKIQLNDH